jgi:hypothetical protein
MAQIYTTCNPIALNCTLYSTRVGNVLSNPVSAGYYYDGNNCWQTNSSGQVIAAGNCIDQVRIDWTVSEEGSGAVQLIIKNNANVEVVNQESQGIEPINGTVYINVSQTPYTVVVNVTAGAEVAQYRICDTNNGTEIVYNSSVSTTSTYVVNPTPSWSTIYATYGNTNTPISCPV